MDEARLQADSAEIERLLADLQGLVPAPVWQRIDDVLRRIVGLYGAGLARALGHARHAGAAALPFDDLVAGDELLASLLVLHGLHPLSTEERVRRALQAARGELGIADGALSLVGIEDGVARLRASTRLGGGAMSERVAEGVIRRVIEAAAPELLSLQIEGLATPRDPNLVQLRTRK